jgi:hypothetical protein
MSTKISENLNKSAYKAKLDIDEDTSFDISYDTFIYEENKKYIYIKLEENTAVAPFYYNRSYEINQLHKINKIFKALDIEETKEKLKSLLDNKRVKLRYEGDMIIMELYVDFFCEQIKIEFELYKEMVPQKEKDKKLLELYFANKKYKKKIKELKNKILNSNQNEMNQNILNVLNEVSDLNDESSSYNNTVEESKGESNYDEE